MRRALADLVANGFRPVPVLTVLAIAACTVRADQSPDNAERARASVTAATPDGLPLPAATTTRTPGKPGVEVLSTAGLGRLRIGAAMPAGIGWSRIAAQASDTCLLYTSPRFPGVYAIIEGGTVQRITATRLSHVTLANGLAVGASETAALGAIAGLKAAPHHYVPSPAKYLSTTPAAPGDPALRLELGGDGRVTDIHVGLMPALGYVEGCA